ncbi:GPI inositol-deacylase-like [Centruroides sculpturatus]|uniref:GPI inositol-deacylase-like n=1 Tax=Centruroides sculpturatus TaxID=218467 RepID=UPI000C6D8141|nr:GPI inositol-deacylase-like [Centruroides sculpturatus]
MLTVLKIILSITMFILCLYGSMRFIGDVETNKCNMTYMFMYPEYIKLPFTSEVKKKFPHYNLYVYGEGFYVNSLRPFCRRPYLCTCLVVVLPISALTLKIWI